MAVCERASVIQGACPVQDCAVNGAPGGEQGRYHAAMPGGGLCGRRARQHGRDVHRRDRVQRRQRPSPAPALQGHQPGGALVPYSLALLCHFALWGSIAEVGSCQGGP